MVSGLKTSVRDVPSSENGGCSDPRFRCLPVRVQQREKTCLPYVHPLVTLPVGAPVMLLIFRARGLRLTRGKL